VDLLFFSNQRNRESTTTLSQCQLADNESSRHCRLHSRNNLP